MIRGAGIYVKGLKAWFRNALILKGMDLTVAPHAATAQINVDFPNLDGPMVVPLKKLGS